MDSYSSLYRAVRSHRRNRSSDLIDRIVEDFVPYRSPDPALVSGVGRIARTEVRVFAQQKPKGPSYQDAEAVNFGMMSAIGYWYIIEEMQKEKAQGRVILTMIDTPGADPSRQGNRHILAWAISSCIASFVTFPGAILSVIIGEGGSGGALALQVADHRLIVSDASYSVISPESCSAILYRDNGHLEEAMGILRPSPVDAVMCGAADEIVDWADDVALENYDAAAAALRKSLVRAMDRITAMPVPKRIRRRRDLLFACGSLRNGKKAVPSTAPPLVRAAGGNGTAPRKKIRCRSSACRAVCTAEQFRASGWACPSCGEGDRLDSGQWLELLCDEGTFQELYHDLDLGNLCHGGYENESYRELRRRTREKHGVGESLRVGVARVKGKPCAVVVSDFRFMAGTLGAVSGEKIRLICREAMKQNLPLLAVTCSGGVRMQDGTLGLVQMAKANAAVLELMSKDLPYVSILANPCTGGALGSYATIAPVVLAEPKALIAFAGPRVMKMAGFTVDESSMRSERLCECGGVDQVVRRTEMKIMARYYFDALSRKTNGSRTHPARKYFAFAPEPSPAMPGGLPAKVSCAPGPPPRVPQPPGVRGS